MLSLVLQKQCNQDIWAMRHIQPVKGLKYYKFYNDAPKVVCNRALLQVFIDEKPNYLINLWIVNNEGKKINSQICAEKRHE